MPTTRKDSIDTTELGQLLDKKLGPLISTIEQLKVSLQTLEPLKATIEDLKAHVETLTTKPEVNDIVQAATADLIQENKQLKDKLLQLECHSRRNNLKILGIPEESGETWDMCELSVNTIIIGLGLDPASIPIERAHRLGPSVAGNRATPRPIIVKFLSFKGREQVLQSFRKRDMDHSVPEDVKMYEDFPSEVELRRSILLPYFHSARH
jgi:hypothetical protein